MLEIKDLKKSYGSFQLHCSLAVEEGMHHRINRFQWRWKKHYL